MSKGSEVRGGIEQRAIEELVVDAGFEPDGSVVRIDLDGDGEEEIVIRDPTLARGKVVPEDLDEDGDVDVLRVGTRPRSPPSPGGPDPVPAYPEVSAGIPIPRLPPEQLEAQRAVFDQVERYGTANLPPEFHQHLGVAHLYYAVNTQCEAWSAEWDGICDEAEEMIGGGRDRVVEFLQERIDGTGMPDWAKRVLKWAVETWIETGEGALDEGLEGARLSGKAGLYLRCLGGFFSI